LLPASRVQPDSDDDPDEPIVHSSHGPNVLISLNSQDHDVADSIFAAPSTSRSKRSSVACAQNGIPVDGHEERQFEFDSSEDYSDVGEYESNNEDDDFEAQLQSALNSELLQGSRKKCSMDGPHSSRKLRVSEHSSTGGDSVPAIEEDEGVKNFPPCSAETKELTLRCLERLTVINSNDSDSVSDADSSDDADYNFPYQTPSSHPHAPISFPKKERHTSVIQCVPQIIADDDYGDRVNKSTAKRSIKVSSTMMQQDTKDIEVPDTESVPSTLLSNNDVVNDRKLRKAEIKLQRRERRQCKKATKVAFHEEKLYHKSGPLSAGMQGAAARLA